MSEDESRRTADVHRLGLSLPRFDATVERRALPASGLYLFFEVGEQGVLDGEAVDRIVRVGTHRVDGRFPDRIRHHYRGNVRSSVFRRHIGSALQARGLSGEGASAAGVVSPHAPDLEQLISTVLAQTFSFVWIPAATIGERLSLERGLIALLAATPLAPPLPGWLGWHASANQIRTSGLWNTQHVAGVPLTDDQLGRLVALAQRT